GAVNRRGSRVIYAAEEPDSDGESRAADGIGCGVDGYFYLPVSGVRPGACREDHAGVVHGDAIGVGEVAARVVGIAEHIVIAGEVAGLVNRAVFIAMESSTAGARESYVHRGGKSRGVEVDVKRSRFVQSVTGINAIIAVIL